MASKKIQLPAIGGIRKVIKTGDATPVLPGTTIAEFANQIVTIAQLRAALGLGPAKPTPSGSTAGSLEVGPGLTGGGPLIGSVPLRLTAPIPAFVFSEEGSVGEPGPPGQRGVDGATGTQGPTGPAIFMSADNGEDGWDAVPGQRGTDGATGAQGPTGPAVFMSADNGEDGWDAVPGRDGSNGATGAQGPMGPAVFLDAEAGDAGDPGPPGAAGPTGPAGTGSQGPIGPAVFFLAEDGHDGDPGPPGVAGTGTAVTQAFSGVRVRKSANQTMTGGADTLTWDTEDYDTDNYHDNVTNNTRLTAPITGYYQLAVSVGWSNAGFSDIEIWINGAVQPAINGLSISLGAGARYQCFTPYKLTAGDYVEFKTVQTGGGTTVNTAGATWGSLTLLGPVSGPAPPTTLAAAILADSPVGFWKCDDASTKFADSSGNGFDLTTLQGTVVFQGTPLIPTLPTTKFAIVGPINGAAGNHGFNLTSQLGQTYPLLNWSAEAIVLPYTNNGVYRFFDVRVSGASTAAAMLLTLTSAGGFSSFYPGTTNVLVAPYVHAAPPMHACFTCSTSAGTSTLSLYLNGVLAAQTTAAQSTTSGTMNAAIGALTAGGANTAPFAVGYVAFYNTALSAARVAAHAVAAGKFGV